MALSVPLGDKCHSFKADVNFNRLIFRLLIKKNKL